MVIIISHTIQQGQCNQSNIYNTCNLPKKGVDGGGLKHTGRQASFKKKISVEFNLNLPQPCGKNIQLENKGKRKKQEEKIP